MKKIEKPYRGRAEIIESEEGLSIKISVQRKWLLIVRSFLGVGVWAIFGIVLLFFLLFATNNEARIEMFIVNVIWGFVGLVSIIGFLWDIKGKQKLAIEDENLLVEKNAILLYRRKRYQLKNIRNFSMNEYKPMFTIRKRDSFWLNTGIVKFDYLGKQPKILLDIDEAEAKEIVKRINSFINNGSN